ncbi:MAG TPA: hypothetical protein VFP27_16440 [Mycobacterium sp.]|nr:hypothetical protein [Mycobacterium sp.]
MPKRRTDTEIAAVDALHDATARVARGIGGRVNADIAEDDDTSPYVHVNARNIGGIKAEYQRGHADVLEVSFSTKDAALAERVAWAIKAAANGG